MSHLALSRALASHVFAAAGDGAAERSNSTATDKEKAPRNVAQQGDALDLLKSLPDACGGAPILGIDPGITGGIATLWPDGRIDAYDIPTVDGSVNVDALVRHIRSHAPRLAVIEKAQAMPKQGVVSVFKYGTAFGALCAATAVLEIPTHLVSPRKWKTHFGLDADKEKSRALAIRLWPGCGLFERKRDHGRSEAALLARYGAEVLEQRP